jgi:transcriptional regulator with XRE-family HTH domain
MKTSAFQKKTIEKRDTLGARLKKARENRSLSLTDVEHETKIRSRYLEAIEENRFDLVPLSHSKGFVRRYAEFIGLSGSDIEEELARLTEVSYKKQPFAPRPIAREKSWIITPRVMLIVLSVIVLIGFIGYITYQVKQFAAPPMLEITKPTGESVVNSETFSIEGKTDVGGAIYVDNLLAGTNSDGTFTYVLTLRPGLNQVVVRAENRIKKQSTKIVSVLYQPPTAPSPTPTPSP